MDIPEIVVLEINAVTDLPQNPQAPPVTLDIGAQTTCRTSTRWTWSLRLSRSLLSSRPRPAIHQRRSHRRSSCRKNNRHRRLHQQKRQSRQAEKASDQRVIEAIPTIPQVNTAGTSAIAVSAALATPLLLKAIRPTLKSWQRNFSRQSVKKSKLRVSRK